MNISQVSTPPAAAERVAAAPVKETPPPSSLTDAKTPSKEFTSMDDLKKAERRGDDITISEEQLVKAIDKAIKAIQGKTTTLEFSVHKETKMISVKVKDANTGEIIREIPPEKTLDLVARMWEMAGLLVDERG